MVCCVDNSGSSQPPSPLHTEIMNTLQHVNGSASERVSKRVCERERESERERERERETVATITPCLVPNQMYVYFDRCRCVFAFTHIICMTFCVFVVI